METLKRCDLMEDAAAVGKNRTAPEQEKATMTVAEAGRRLGIGRNSAYEAARRQATRGSAEGIRANADSLVANPTCGF
jgi:hypothetical protein